MSGDAERPARRVWPQLLGVAALFGAAGTGAVIAGAASAQTHAAPRRQPPVPRRDTTPRPAGRDTVPRAAGQRDTTRRDTTRRDTTRRVTPGDSARADSTGRSPADTGANRKLVTWEPADSIMQALEQREGYTVVRYQGDTVRFRADDRVLTLRGAPAAVEREETLLVGQSIDYNDSTQIIVARGDSAKGDTVFLRDPKQGSDVIVRGGITYNIAEQRGIVSSFNTSLTEGETWFVSGSRGAIVNDTTVQGRRIFYAHNGSVTSCSETVPHYHFQARDIKMVSRNLLVIRPATLYIADVPVLWLPFVFQDMRSGRRSGLLTPRFGIAELVRNSPTYRRGIENLGYYVNLGDYADAQAWLDWRSGARATSFDPGWVRLNAETRYRWINRFIQGRLSTAYTAQRDGSRNLAASLGHEQAFNQNRRLQANLNWVQNTAIQRQNTINPAAVLGTINSQLNYSDKLGPASLQLGGSAKQYPGRPQRDLDFPSLNISSPTLNLREWLDWTPTFSLSNSQSFRIDQGQQFGYLYGTNKATGLPDSSQIRPSRRSTTMNFGTPTKIFDFAIQNSFTFSETVENFPQTRVVYRDVRDTTSRETRVFNQTFLSSLDWTTSFSLPRFFQGTWNVAPTVSLSNVESRGGLFVRSEQSGGRWVRQNKRLSYGLSASPTFYAFPPGFGVVERLRHSVNPVLSLSYSPKADVSDEFLRAIGGTRVGYLGALAQANANVQVSMNLEAKLRAPRGAGSPAAPAPPSATGDTASVTRPDSARVNQQGSGAGEGRKVRLLSLNLTPFNYDFIRADSLGGSLFNRRGITTETFGISARSDLLPGLDFRTNYSLFLGSVNSDTAVFKPYRTDMNVSFAFDQSSALFATIARLLGRDTPGTSTQNTNVPTQSRPGGAPGGDPFFARQSVAQQVAGSGARNSQFDLPNSGQWQASFTYTQARQRPDIRGTIIDIDPTRQCQQLLGVNPLTYEQCVIRAQTQVQQPGTQLGQTTYGGAVWRQPAQQSLQANTSFHITPKWAATWSTTYDMERAQFASNVVSLQRELHDWRAIFAFTQAPNGNFAFNFFIALKAQPDIKFDYNRQTYRAPGTSTGLNGGLPFEP